MTQVVIHHPPALEVQRPMIRGRKNDAKGADGTALARTLNE
jgi:hypothetical protein